MSLGDRPGLTAKVHVTQVTGVAVTFKFDEPEDTGYFKENGAYVAHFLPVPDGDSGSDAEKHGGG